MEWTEIEGVLSKVEQAALKYHEGRMRGAYDQIEGEIRAAGIYRTTEGNQAFLKALIEYLKTTALDTWRSIREAIEKIGLAPTPEQEVLVIARFHGRIEPFFKAWKEFALVHLGTGGFSLYPVIDQFLESVLDIAKADIAVLAMKLRNQQGQRSPTFNTTIHTNNGNMAAGYGIQQTSAVALLAGDFHGLAANLKGHGVPDEDIQALKGAIAEDGPPTTQRSFGKKVAAWIGSMVAKSAEGTWKVATAVAANVLTEGLKQYYGLGKHP
jgi:hypothetical protein